MVTGAIDTIELKQNRKMWRFCSFYTKSDPILNYMTNKLNVRTGDKILEPCAGNGDFINKLLDFNNQFNFSIDAVDLNDKSILNLKDIFNNKTNIYIRKTDTLLDEVFDFYAGMGGAYDKVIGNPPYGAYQNFERRKILKAKYTGYVRETYTLFLKRCITLLKENGKLVFIIPDTFLALHLHKNTREYLLKETSIDEILLIPTKFFPDVDFRYSDLCIITLTKKKSDNNHNIKIVSVDNSVEILSELAINDYRNVTSVQTIKQKSISESKDYSFLLGSNSNLRNLINNHDLFLGDIANCVTGFYSGDNKKFVFVDNI
ncbi:MAG: N-6 DNA methylase [Candidatus Margulisbacteria bacterium]|jgi:type I restriction-modification system DNA methylase subunit|nr:N-6 DNA methylase [Candidatus Margulisiibacteriota bacterium]